MDIMRMRKLGTPFDVTAPGYSLSNNVCMDCCCILSAPSWASYKYTFGLDCIGLDAYRAHMHIA